MKLLSKKLSAVSNVDDLTNNKALSNALAGKETLTFPYNTGKASRISIKTRVLGSFSRFHPPFVFFLPA